MVNLKCRFLDSMDSIDIIFFLGTELAELIRGAKMIPFSSLFDILLYHYLVFLFDLATKFSNLQLALSVFWQSYFPLPRLVSCLVKKNNHWN